MRAPRAGRRRPRGVPAMPPSAQSRPPAATPDPPPPGDSDHPELRRAPHRPPADPAFLAAIVESSDDAIISKTLDGIISSWNKAAERMFGYAQTEAIGQPIYLLIPPELADEEAGIITRLRRGERVEHYETVRMRKDGSRFDVSLTVSPIRDEDGTIIGASKIVRDITAHKSTELELRRRTAQLTAFVETAHIGLHWVGPDGTILWANPAEMEMLGYRPDEYIGHNIAEFHADEPVISAILGSLSNGGRLQEYEARLRCKDGSFKHVIIDSSVLWEEGRFVHTQCFTRDITARKHAIEELQRANARLRESDFILNHAGWAVATIDSATNRIQFCNPAFARMHGYSVDEMRGRPFAEMFAPEWLEHWPEHLEPISRGVDHIYESVHRRKDGGTFPVRTHATTLQDADGRPRFRAAVFEDITERRNAEAAQRESEARLRAVADNISQFVWMADEQGSIDWYNQRWFDYTGTTLEEMQGWGWQKVHHPDHVDRVVAKFRAHVASGEIWEDTFPLRGKDGSYRWFLSRAVPIRNGSARVLRWFGTNTDITELRETQHALEAARAQLAGRAADLETAVAQRTAELTATIAELESVSYSLSHDMRAPLRTIHGFSQIVLEEAGDKLGPTEVELLQKCIRAANRLDRLIQDILTYSRLAKSPAELKTVNVDRLLREVIEERPELQPPRAEITIRGPLQPVRGHEAYFTQCITNLLDNAVKFVAPDRRPAVRIWDERVGQQVRLWFEDNGVGIPPESRHRLFGIFQRLHPDPRFPGTGIGLAIVRKAAERMHGSVGVESTPGTGSRFWLQLPAGDAPP